MAEIRATVNSSKRVQARTLTVGTAQRLSDLSDVDVSLLGDGAVLIYDATSETFKANPEVENSNTKIIGGSF